MARIGRPKGSKKYTAAGFRKACNGYFDYISYETTVMKQTVDLDRSIELVLLELHFNTQLCGYPCVVEAIKQMIADPLAQITKSVYPEVAKVCGGGDKRVEHAMRSCIRDAWKHRNEEIWQMYFPSDRKIQTAPANGQFIARIAKCFAGKEAHQQKPLANGSEN